MTAITTDDVMHLAQLSALTLSEKEAEDLRVDIASILDYVEQLSDLDTTDVEPTYQVTGLTNVTRDDVIVRDVARDDLLALAPSSTNHQIKVPKVL